MGSMHLQAAVVVVLFLRVIILLRGVLAFGSLINMVLKMMKVEDKDVVGMETVGVGGVQKGNGKPCERPVWHSTGR